MNTEVIEWAPFKMKPGIDEKTLLKLAEQLQSGFLAARKGYRKRELARARTGSTSTSSGGIRSPTPRRR